MGRVVVLETMEPCYSPQEISVSVERCCEFVNEERKKC
jgi:hypothetical protein